MKRRITGISIRQFAKITGIFYGVVGCLFVPVAILIALFDTKNRITGLLFLFAPFVYGAMGYLFGAFGAWAFNFVAQNFGGIEVTVEDASEAS